MHNTPPIDNLPASLRQIIDLVGLAPALALVQSFSGNVIQVPIGARPGGKMRERLSALMGEDAAEKMIAAYGGERLAIPRCVAALRDTRDRQIIADYDAGQPVAVLAGQNLLTERQIRTILKRSPRESAIGIDAGQVRQISLF